MLDLEDEALKGLEFLKLRLIDKLIAQGHINNKETSKIIKSMTYLVNTVSSDVVGEFYMNDYFVYLDKGVKASSIPYGRKTGKKHSKYIQALIKYWRFYRHLNIADSKRAAFATARKHKKEGMPTRASFKHSKDGTRLSFLTKTLNDYSEDVVNLLEKNIGFSLDVIIENVLDNLIK